MGPCHSSSKKKLNNSQIPENQPQPPVQPSNLVGSPNHVQEKPPGAEDQNIRENMPFPVPQEQKDEKEENTPNKLKNEENIGSSGLKKVNNRYDQSEDSINKSNAIAKQEPNQNQEVKMGSHFYYNQKENEGNVDKEGIKNLEYEEHEFKEPADYKNSLHSNQLNRREIFSETKKSKFIKSKNTGDSDEPEEMDYEEIPVI